MCFILELQKLEVAQLTFKCSQHFKNISCNSLQPLNVQKFYLCTDFTRILLLQ